MTTQTVAQRVNNTAVMPHKRDALRCAGVATIALLGAAVVMPNVRHMEAPKKIKTASCPSASSAAEAHTLFSTALLRSSAECHSFCVSQSKINAA